MKNEKELENIKEEIKNLNTELQELSDDELSEVTGGIAGKGGPKKQVPTLFATMAPGSSLGLLGAVANIVQTEPTGGVQVMVKGTEMGVVTDEIKQR